MSDAEMSDWDAALVDLIAEEKAYSEAAALFAEWAATPYGEFTKLDAAGTVAIAVAAYLAGYPHVQALIEDLDESAVAWLIELMESFIIQGIFIGLGAPTGHQDAEQDLIYMSPNIVNYLKGGGYGSRFDPPKGLHPDDTEE